MEFRNVQPGRIFHIGDIAYAKLRKPLGARPTAVSCRGGCCQHSWNATNFAYDVHFCPNTQVEGTKYNYTEKED